MPDHKWPDHKWALLAVAFALLTPGTLLAYAGPGPGLELIPYFLGLLAWAGMAFGAIILWPLSAAIRRLRKEKHSPKEPTDLPQMGEVPTAAVPAGNGEYPLR